jgi:CSLREA domain-containing protein
MAARIALVLCTALSFSAAARSADFAVDRLDDPVPNGCTSGHCTLREAVLAANATAGQDRILLPAATLMLTREGDDEDAAASGDLDVVDPLEIVGQGSGASIVQQNVADRVIEVRNAGFVRLHGVTVRGGSGASHGAGIRANDTTVELLDTHLVDNTSDSVAGMSFQASANAQAVPRLTVRNSRFEGNVSAFGTGALSISASGQPNGPFALIEDSSFVGNSAGTPGTYGSSAGISISHLGNDDSAQIVLRRVVMNENIARASGGAISVDYNGGPGPLLLLEDSELCNNSTTVGGGALRVGSRAIVRRTTFCNNSAPPGDTLFSGGGAIDVFSTAPGTALTLERSTLTGNSSTRGGAILVSWGRINVNGTTITAPTFVPVGTQGTVLFVEDTASDTFVLRNNLWQGSCHYEDVAAKPSVATNNLEAPGDTCRLTTATTSSGNQVSVTSSLLQQGTLADNGGPTRTRMPGATSVAIDAGQQAQCLYPDQRGYPEGDGGCDAGALERSATVQGFSDGFETDAN